MFDMW